jgi:hypothetical protein
MAVDINHTIASQAPTVTVHSFSVCLGTADSQAPSQWEVSLYRISPHTGQVHRPDSMWIAAGETGWMEALERCPASPQRAVSFIRNLEFPYPIFQIQYFGIPTRLFYQSIVTMQYGCYLFKLNNLSKYQDGLLLFCVLVILLP